MQTFAALSPREQLYLLVCRAEMLRADTLFDPLDTHYVATLAAIESLEQGSVDRTVDIYASAP